MTPTAQEIIDYAARHKINLVRGGVPNSLHPNNMCAAYVLLHMCFGTTYDVYRSDFPQNNRMGLTYEQLMSLELGFEGVDFSYESAVDLPMFLVGQEIARITGYTQED